MVLPAQGNVDSKPKGSILATDPVTGNPVELIAVQDGNGDWHLSIVNSAPAGYDQPTDSIKTQLLNDYIETAKAPYIITNVSAGGNLNPLTVLVADEIDWEAVDFRSVAYAIVAADVVGSNELRWLGFRTNTFIADYMQQSFTQTYDRTVAGFVAGLGTTEKLIDLRSNRTPASYGSRVSLTTVRLYPGSRWQRFEIYNTHAANAWPYYSIQRIGFR